MTRYIPQIISAVVGLGLVIVGAVLLARGQYEQGAAVIAGGLGTLALPRVRMPRRKPSVRGVIVEHSRAAVQERGNGPQGDGYTLAAGEAADSPVAERTCDHAALRRPPGGAS